MQIGDRVTFKAPAAAEADVERVTGEIVGSPTSTHCMVAVDNEEHEADLPRIVVWCTLASLAPVDVAPPDPRPTV